MVSIVFCNGFYIYVALHRVPRHFQSQDSEHMDFQTYQQTFQHSSCQLQSYTILKTLWWMWRQLRFPTQSKDEVRHRPRQAQVLYSQLAIWLLQGKMRRKKHKNIYKPSMCGNCIFSPGVSLHIALKWWGCASKVHGMEPAGWDPTPLALLPSICSSSNCSCEKLPTWNGTNIEPSCWSSQHRLKPAWCSRPWQVWMCNRWSSNPGICIQKTNNVPIENQMWAIRSRDQSPKHETQKG